MVTVAKEVRVATAEIRGTRLFARGDEAQKI